MKDVLNVLQNEAKTNLGVKDVLVQSPELYKGIHRQANSIWFSSKKSINWLTSQILLCGNNALSGLGFSSISRRDFLPEFEIKYWHILQLIQRQNKNLTKHLTHWEFCNRSERCTSGVQNKTGTLHVIGCWLSSKKKRSHMARLSQVPQCSDILYTTIYSYRHYIMYYVFYINIQLYSFILYISIWCFFCWCYVNYCLFLLIN